MRVTHLKMRQEPRHQGECDSRQTEAARPVLVDIGQALASFRDCMVVVGGWVPDLLLSGVEEPHVGSIDVDIALNANKLSDGRYAELLKLLLGTRRYRLGDKPFQLVTETALEKARGFCLAVRA
jgi:tRNA nucleotidyltransferase/poly(A) polymerase